MRGSIQKRYRGSYSLVLDLGEQPDPTTGRLKRRQKWLTFHGTRKEAQLELTKQLRAHDTGTFVDPSTLTLLAWLREWLRLTAAHVRPATVVRYRGVVDNHVAKAAIAALPIQKLRASHLEAYYAEISAGSRPVHHTVLNRALRKAVREKLILFNPAADLDRAPRRRAAQATEAARANCWTASEAQAFLQTAKAHSAQAAALYALALDSGARKSELCGLRWADVDLEGSKIRIVQQLTKPGPDPTFGPPKNGCSRDVTIALETAALLREHKRSQAALKMVNRTTYRDLGLVFAKEYGDLTNRADLIALPLQANHLAERHFNRLVKAAEVRQITFHGMRHTCATLLLQAGQPVHVVSKRLGHARVEITLNTYAHVLPDMQQEAAATMGALLHR